MNTWMFETCRRQYNWINSLVKECILLVLITYEYQNARFKKRKINFPPFCIIIIIIIIKITKCIYIINIAIIMFVNGVKRVLPHLFCVAGLLSNERPVPRVWSQHRPLPYSHFLLENFVSFFFVPGSIFVILAGCLEGQNFVISGRALLVMVKEK